MRPVLHQQHVASAEDQALRLEVVGALLILMIICKISFDLLMLMVNISLICKICLSLQPALRSLFARINNAWTWH